MKLGSNLPVAGHATSPALIARVAEQAEAMGLDSVWTADCVLRPTRQPIDFGNGMEIEMPPETASQYELATPSRTWGPPARTGLGPRRSRLTTSGSSGAHWIPSTPMT